MDEPDEEADVVPDEQVQAARHVEAGQGEGVWRRTPTEERMHNLSHHLVGSRYHPSVLSIMRLVHKL